MMGVTIPTREQLKFAQELTYEMAFRLKTNADDTSLREKYALPDIVEAIDAIAGVPVIAHSSNHNYLRAQNASPRYVPANLPFHSISGNEAVGIVMGIVSPPPAQETKRRRADRVCLQIGPLALLGNPEWRNYYKAHGRLDQYYHPYANAAFARRMAWLPLVGMAGRKLVFPNTPSESTYGIARVWV